MSAPKPGTVVGEVAGLARYPVKGMRGEVVGELHFGWHGPQGDRSFSFLRLSDTTGLPFLSPRRCPDLATYRAIDLDAQVVVHTPDNDEYEIRDPRLLKEIEELARDRLHLVRLWSHATDAMDVSLITDASIAAAGRLIGRDLDQARFRANLIVNAVDDHRDHPEDRWVGATLVGGFDNAMLHIARTTQRCTVVNIDPRTGVQDDDVFRAIRDERKNRLGVYATVHRPGTLAVGDALAVRR